MEHHKVGPPIQATTVEQQALDLLGNLCLIAPSADEAIPRGGRVLPAQLSLTSNFEMANTVLAPRSVEDAHEIGADRLAV